MVLLLAGCAHFNTTQKDISFNDAGKPQREITTQADATTFLAGKETLSKWKASQTDKSQTASVGELNMESNSTNLVQMLTLMLQILNSAK